MRIIACVVSVLLHFGSFSIYKTRDQMYPDHSLYFPASSKRFVEFLFCDFIVRDTLCECSDEITEHMHPFLKTGRLLCFINRPSKARPLSVLVSSFTVSVR